MLFRHFSSECLALPPPPEVFNCFSRRHHLFLAADAVRCSHHLASNDALPIPAPHISHASRFETYYHTFYWLLKKINWFRTPNTWFVRSLIFCFSSSLTRSKFLWCWGTGATQVVRKWSLRVLLDFRLQSAWSTEKAGGKRVRECTTCLSR